MKTPRTKRQSAPPDAHAFGELDAHLMREGKHPRLYDKLGSHPIPGGTRFAVWAPHATSVAVVGDFNAWKPTAMRQLPATGGVWSVDVKGVEAGAIYKYLLASERTLASSAAEGQRGEIDATLWKADPFAFRHQREPDTASVVWAPSHAWRDQAWMLSRSAKADQPISIYEVHLGSWMRVDGESLSYLEIAPKLVEHVTKLGFTHVELMPLTEHPFFGSWGYETTGYFAATARYGKPEDLMALVDALHAAGVGVILDWVPAHFPNDPHGLANFDGQPLFEHPDRRLGFHPEWNTQIFDFGRQEVRSFLLSSALYWLEQFHVDGLRVDGVASMLYRDYGRQDDWVPNRDGGHEYWEAVELLQRLTAAIAREVPAAITVAEESTAWPHVTGTDERGLGFSFKWDMGWMHDTLAYLAHEPIHRKYHHQQLTFRGVYAYSERFVLPLSHDEVVHGKKSLLNKFPGDRWQQLATLRALYAYMYSQPGKKLLFMGGELAQEHEWNHDGSLEWELLAQEPHRQIALLVGELNRLYKDHAPLHELDCEPGGMQWVVADDSEQSVFAYERLDRSGARILCVHNFTPVVRHNYRIGVTQTGVYRELLNTDAVALGGSGQGNLGGVEAVPVRAHGRELSIVLTLPPLAGLYLQR